MSWGFQEGFSIFASDRQKYDNIFTTTGVTFVASSGNSGRRLPQYPATSPNVIAVGGTSLTLNPNGSYASESLWLNASGNIGSGFGTSLFENAPAYQTNVSSSGRRQMPDVSMVADPSTGLWVADTTADPLGNPLQVLGGTSLATPIWAGIMAMTNQARLTNGLGALNTSSPTETHEALYNAPSSMFNRVIDITNQFSGSNSFGPSGLGTPVVNKLIESLGNTQFRIINTRDTSLSTPPASHFSEAIGSIHASPIASVLGSQTKNQPIVISSRAIDQGNPNKTVFHSVKRPQSANPNHVPRTHVSRMMKPGGNLTNFIKKAVSPVKSAKKQPSVAGSKPILSTERTVTVDHASDQIIDLQSGSQRLVDHVFHQGSEEFWDQKVGYRKYLRKKN
jgi:hypothetical protein